MRKIAVYEQCLGNRKIMNFDSIFTLVPSKFQGLFEVLELKKKFPFFVIFG